MSAVIFSLLSVQSLVSCVEQLTSALLILYLDSLMIILNVPLLLYTVRFMVSVYVCNAGFIFFVYGNKT